MIHYFDTSALVKKYVRETGSSHVVRCWRDAEVVATSVVTYAEAMAAFHKKRRESALTPHGLRSIIRSFHSDWGALLRVAVTEDLNGRIQALAARHPLRGFDTIHLGSALFLRETLNDEIVFLCADNRLAAAARDEGLQVFPESQ